MTINIGQYKLAWFDDCYGWIMTGVIGPNAKWFLGFSINNNAEALKDPDTVKTLGENK